MVDLHNDFLTEIKSEKMQMFYAQKYSKVLDFLCCPIWTSNLKNAKNFIQNKQKLIKNYQKMQICIEDVGFLNPTDFNFLTQINALYVGFVWNNSNMYGGGAYDKGGLTKFGKALVRFLNDNKIIVDASHMNYKTFYDMCCVTQKPIFCSHTGFYGIVKNKRNITDQQIKDIVQSGGIVGLYFVGKYISKNKVATSGDIVKNIDYFAQKFGIDNLAIGTDFYGTTDLPIDVKNYTQLGIVQNKLQKIGYTMDDIKKIFKKNATTFLNKGL